MKYQVLFSLENNEKIFKSVISAVVIGAFKVSKKEWANYCMYCISSNKHPFLLKAAMSFFCIGKLAKIPQKIGFRPSKFVIYCYCP